MAWLIKMRNSLSCLEIVKRLYLVHKGSHFCKVYDKWLVDSLTLNFEEATTKFQKPTAAQYFT